MQSESCGTTWQEKSVEEELTKFTVAIDLNRTREGVAKFFCTLISGEKENTWHSWLTGELVAKNRLLCSLQKVCMKDGLLL
jgi:hypothetical protein